MRRFVRGFALFAAGIAAGVFMMQPSKAQQDKLPGWRVNHVGVFAKDFDESYNFYTKTLGFHEAFTFKDKEGKVTTAYLQVNKDTFVELARAGDRAPGLNQVGIWVDDINATVAALRQRGVKVEDARSGNSKAPLTNITDPNGVRIELLEFAPDSMQRKAIESWK